MRNLLLPAIAAGLIAASAAQAQTTENLAGLPAWDVVLVAHRGLAPDYPENTMAAFQNVIDRGVGVIEIDLRGTADGRVIIMHDETVDRTTDGTGAVSDLTFEQIRALDAGSHAGAQFAGERVPTYEEVLQLAKHSGVMLLLDIKESPSLNREMVVRITEQYDAALNVIAGVRSLEDLAYFRSLNPNIRTLGFIPSPESIDAFADAGVNAIRLWPYWINGDRIPAACNGDHHCLIDQVAERGLPVWSTAGEAGRVELLELIRLGVSGILTDLPAVLDELLEDIDTFRATQ